MCTVFFISFILYSFLFISFFKENGRKETQKGLPVQKRYIKSTTQSLNSDGKYVFPEI